MNADINFRTGGAISSFFSSVASALGIGKGSSKGNEKPTAKVTTTDALTSKENSVGQSLGPALTQGDNLISASVTDGAEAITTGVSAEQLADAQQALANFLGEPHAETGNALLRQARTGILTGEQLDEAAQLAGETAGNLERQGFRPTGKALRRIFDQLTDLRVQAAQVTEAVAEPSEFGFSPGADPIAGGVSAEQLADAQRALDTFLGNANLETGQNLVNQADAGILTQKQLYEAAQLALETGENATQEGNAELGDELGDLADQLEVLRRKAPQVVEFFANSPEAFSGSSAGLSIAQRAGIGVGLSGLGIGTLGVATGLGFGLGLPSGVSSTGTDIPTITAVGFNPDGS